MEIAAGTRLGPYEIVGQLGAGGMGEVYRACDRRLGRDVAVKVLPSALGDDSDRRRRFELEARAAGALAHPNVLVVFDVGAQGSTAYLVTELLEGETLRDKLAAGAPPLLRAMEWAVQIADGLAAAHDRGIVHRDVKPENLFLTRDGRIKILDFGLAKAISGSEPASNPDSTLAADPTRSGVVLGTAGYMAPEQVMAKSVDARSDLFAFGAVLYELLTGQRAFGEGSQVERAYAVLKDDPPAMTELNPEVFPALELIVRRCLEKQPEERFQSARDLSFHLRSVSITSGLGGRASVVTSLPTRSIPRAALVGAALIAAVAAAIPTYLMGRHAGERDRVLSANLALTPATSTPLPHYTRLTYRRGVYDKARFAPDGKSIVYSEAFNGGRAQILTVTSGRPDSRVLSDNLIILAVSSSGELAVAIPSSSTFAPFTLGRMAFGARVPRAVLAGVELADWAPDGTRFAVVIDEHTARRLEYPIGHVLARVTGEIGALRVSPDGKLVAFVYWPTRGDDRGTVELVDARGARRTVAGPFLSLRGVAWSADGRELWFATDPSGGYNGMEIHAASLDGKDRVVATIPERATLLDRASDGRILLCLHVAIRNEIKFHGPGVPGERELSWFDGSSMADVSADGKTLLFAEGRETVHDELMIYTRPTSGEPAVPLGTGCPYALSPDGQWVLAAPRIPQVELELLPTGPGQPRALRKGPIVEYGELGGFFPGGERIWFLARDHAVPRLWVQDLAAGDPRPLLERAVSTIPHGLSPDGKTFLLGDPSDGSFFELDVDGGAPRPQTFPLNADPVGWTSDGGIYLVRQFADVDCWSVTRWDRTTRSEQALPALRADPCFNPTGGSALVNSAAALVSSNFRFSPGGAWYAVESLRLQTDLYVISGLE
jgi:eukaryotic-like serine/threonine-protein kinase